jgi:hypothetical protein
MGKQKHGHNVIGKRSKLYTAWANMKRRCKCRNKKDGENYQNIKYCEEWEKFEPFMEWAVNNGYSEELTLERIDVHKNYEPSNCRWATQKEQQRNKTNSKWITYNGKTQCLADWAEELGFELDTLKSRFLRGWDVERALTESLGEGRRAAINNRKRDEKGRIV